MSPNRDEESPPTNTRRQRQESDRRLLYLVIFTLVVVGGILIAIIYGPESLLTALPCLLAGAGMILIPWFLLAVLQKWRDRVDGGG
jgi:protein-S-isoprenylcysteine O-methyltransferase Ste14